MGEEPQTTDEGAEQPSAPTRIGIAIVEDAGRILVGVRQEDQVLAGHAEFPGGKCEPGESPRDCAIRECLEETGISVEAVRLFDRIEFQYPHATVDLHFWLCQLAPTVSPRAQPQNGFRWHAAVALGELNFPEANAAVVKELIRRFSADEA